MDIQDASVAESSSIDSQQAISSNQFHKEPKRRTGSVYAVLAVVLLIGALGVANIFDREKRFRAFTERLIELESAIEIGISLDAYSEKVQALSAELNKIKLDVSSGNLLGAAEEIVDTHRIAHNFWVNGSNDMGYEVQNWEFRELADALRVQPEQFIPLGYKMGHGRVSRKVVLQSLWQVAELQAGAFKK